MRSTTWLLATVVLAGCGGGPELELSPPDFFEDGNLTADPAELQNMATGFPLDKARFIHSHLHATHPRLKSDFLLSSTCELIDHATRATLAKVEQKIPFASGAFRTAWVVTFGQETPGQWKAGGYRVACKVGKHWTSASFEVVP